jgi:hypothetical protein
LRTPNRKEFMANAIKYAWGQGLDKKAAPSQGGERGDGVGYCVTTFEVIGLEA